jgi:hypothetical protein
MLFGPGTAREETMRTISAAMLVTAGIGLVSTSATSAMPINAATMAGAAHIEQVTQVHCRSYIHWHPWGYGYGCQYYGGWGWYDGWGWPHHHYYWRPHHWYHDLHHHWR